MPRKPKDSLFIESAYLNNRTYQQYYNRLTELAMSMFEWKNLPDDIDERYLEMCLYSRGYALFYMDENMKKYLALQCTISGKRNVYQIPIDRRAFAPNGYNYTRDESNSVLIFNNYVHTNSMLDVEMFAKRLYNLDRAIDVNANAQKTPVLITCSEKERLTMINLYKKYEGNEPFIFGNDSLDPNSLKVLTTGAPFVADKLYQLKVQYWNEILTYLGISNINTQKKERMVTDEVTRNQGGVVASRYSRLGMRQKACKEINKMFDLDISVDFREDFQEIVERVGDSITGKENDDEPVYD